MQLAGIVRDSIVDGVGIRDVIFLQGCSHHCKGCHNPKTWNTEAGEIVTSYEAAQRLHDRSNDVTISGGEPLDQFNSLLSLAKCLLNDFGKHSWLYTGYKYENISPYIWSKLAEYGVTVVVDGRYEEDKKDPSLLFRGSSNQRLIDLPKTVKEGKIILWEETE